MYFVLKMEIFYCYVSLPDGICDLQHPLSTESSSKPSSIHISWSKNRLYKTCRCNPSCDTWQGTGVTVPTTFNGINMKTFNRELPDETAWRAPVLFVIIRLSIESQILLNKLFGIVLREKRVLQLRILYLLVILYMFCGSGRLFLGDKGNLWDDHDVMCPLHVA